MTVKFSGQNVANVGHLLWSLTLERALSPFPGRIFVPVMLHCVLLCCHCVQPIPRYQVTGVRSRFFSQKITVCSEKLQQELVAMTRVPQCLVFTVQNKSSLWETKKDGKPFSLYAW